MREIAKVLALASVLAAAGCSSSHTAGGEPCGPTRCSAGELCCNASCGICIAPGGSCPDIACADAGGPGPAHCGDEVCGAGERCCAGCPGESPFCASGSCPDIACPPPACEGCAPGQECCPACPGQPPICVSEGAACPIIECPPPPPGCDACGPGELCCPSCPDAPPICTPGSTCPEVDCPPPPSCGGACGSGQRCCPGCDGAPPFCYAGDACPPPECPPAARCDETRPCADGFYCDFDAGCGGSGRCEPLPTGCTADCPGVCGCDGHTYCNGCVAAAAGVDVAHTASCETRACAGRDYCDCHGGCAPLVDLSTGCICPCDDPFNCSGETCACACGGATYLGCAPAGACADPMPNCGPGCHASLGADGCPICLCADRAD